MLYLRKALTKVGIDEGHISREIYAMYNTTPVSFYEALDSLGGPPQQVNDVNKEMMRMRDENKARAMTEIQPFDTTESLASFLYETYIEDLDEDLDDMNKGLERLGDQCATKDFNENFKGSVCLNQFF